MITKLNITFDTDGKRVNLEGPLDDTILVLGLLEMAKVVILERRLGLSGRKDIIIPTLQVPQNAK